jgi:hypothetical protein
MKTRFEILALTALIMLIFGVYKAFQATGISQAAFLNLYTPALAQSDDPP